MTAELAAFSAGSISDIYKIVFLPRGVVVGDFMTVFLVRSGDRLLLIGRQHL